MTAEMPLPAVPMARCSDTVTPAKPDASAAALRNLSTNSGRNSQESLFCNCQEIADIGCHDVCAGLVFRPGGLRNARAMRALGPWRRTC